MPRVLVVDDAMFMRYSLRTILTNNGFDVVGEAENGEVAIKKYLELSPDIVTMDITMPEMDGIAAVKEIKRLDPNSKIIMISALGQQSYVVEAVKCGAKGFLIKPFKEEQVIKAISRIV